MTYNILIEAPEPQKAIRSYSYHFERNVVIGMKTMT